MTKTKLIPLEARFFPSKEQRLNSKRRNQEYTKDDFETYNDWFYFIHIDPAQRFVHAFGMYVGTFFFAMIFIEWSILSILYYLLGVFFFYVLGIISHFIYDSASAKSEPKYFLHTLIPVIKFNLLTTFGGYDKSLRAFTKKYPFVIKAYDLVEVPTNKVISHLYGS